MKKKQVTTTGFALLEILVSTLILCGVIYGFIAFTQNQDKKIAQENIGKYLAILTNDVIKSTLANGNCAKPAVYQLTQCVDIDPDSKPLLDNNGFAVDSAIVQITTHSDSATITIMLQFKNGAYSALQGNIYTQEILDNLSPDSIRRFTANTPTNHLVSYGVGDEYKNTDHGSILRFYITVKDDY